MERVQIPGASYLFVKFDNQCNTAKSLVENSDELWIASDEDFKEERHVFSGDSPSHWPEFYLPSDVLFFKFCKKAVSADSQNWGWKFTVTGWYM